MSEFKPLLLSEADRQLLGYQDELRQWQDDLIQKLAAEMELPKELYYSPDGSSRSASLAALKMFQEALWPSQRDPGDCFSKKEISDDDEFDGFVL